MSGEHGAPDTVGTGGSAPVAPTGGGRIPAIDMMRGLAIIGMIVYHFTWDLRFFQFIALDVTAEPGWVAFQRLLVGTFLFLAGVSLVLAHGQAIRWPAFWKRFGLVLGAGMLVTAGTYAFAPETFVYFGVLHAIAVFSLLALAFLRLPIAVVALAALVIIAMPLFVSHPFFSARVFSIFGLWDVPPPSEDLVPVFPWFGVVLAGVAAARMALGAGWMERLRAVPSGSLPARFLGRAGRWSLIIYLLHQPVMIGVLMGVATVVPVNPEVRSAEFSQSCQASCYASNGYQDYCTAYCACALDRVETEDLWAMLENQRTQAEEDYMVEFTNQCAAEAIESQDVPAEDLAR
ncbi:DUF1624 domain-containing protein [Pelagibacterium montanilacus]|uniref:DUF1624 domain-containing protein n=1 Tax=Pelagibacterium montanilacus TaxID=2185280 RepID=UPI000F8C8820|nr:heparan-alpha-glucosaminide N-acetyltransferase [Pelagibacterium montanilacus]